MRKGDVVNHENELKYYQQLQLFDEILYSYSIIEDIAKLIFDYMVIEEIYIYNDSDCDEIFHGINYINCDDCLEIKDIISTDCYNSYNYDISIEYRLPFLKSDKEYHELFRSEFYIMNYQNTKILRLQYMNIPSIIQLKNLQDSHAIIFQTNENQTAITYLYINKKFFK